MTAETSGGGRGIPPNLMKPGEVAALFRVDVTSVRRWANERKLNPVRTPGGTRRYLTAEVLAFYRGEAPRG